MAVEKPTDGTADACPDIAALARYAEGGPWAEGEGAPIAEHLGRCAACRARLAEVQEAEDFLRRLRPGSTAEKLTPTGLPRAGRGPTSSLAEIAERPGSVVGHYTLLEQIGEGGFGVVFSAQQNEPVSRRVALKILKPGMDSRQVLARFEAERHTLALMDHPNIARVLDAGSTDTGRPYFVMELVEGVPITRYCDDATLTIRERLELFRQVCAAVQHAHQKGVIHRDIKPSNVMVTVKDGVAVPKVIDFGIAKATDQHLAEQAAFTRLGQFIGTPEYTSPEQAAGPRADIDTRSDVYSLGVLLYELLTGATPIDPEILRGAGLAEMQRVIREGSTPRPSTRLSTIGSLEEIAASRRIDPRRLALQLRGDLDWILLKTLEKERSRRYDTVAALNEDLRRYLENEAVLAGPPNAAYRMRKFVRRNRAAVTGGAVVTAVLVAGLAGTTAGMVRARAAERQRAAEAEWATQVASVQATPFLSDELRDAHRAEWETRLQAMRNRLAPDDVDLVHQEGLFAAWGWTSYVGVNFEGPIRAEVAPPNYGLPDRIWQSRIEKAEAATEWGARVSQACERARGILAISDPLWVALVHDMIVWKSASGAPAEDLATWYDTMVEASDAAYGELSDFSLAMLCERAAALGEAESYDEGLEAIWEYLRRREHATMIPSEEQYARQERLVAIFDKHDSAERYGDFMKLHNQDAKDLSERTTSTYFIYAGQQYGMWLWTYGHYEEADHVLSELLGVMRSPLANVLTTTRLVYRIGVCRMMLGRPEQALDLLRETETSLMTKSIGRYQACYLARARGWLGQCLSDLGSYEEAEPPLLAAQEWFSQHAIEEEDLTEATGRLVQLYERWGKADEVDAWRGKLAESALPAPDDPRNLDFEEGAEGQAPPGWRVFSAAAESGLGAMISHEGAAHGAACVRIPAAPPGRSINWLGQNASALPYRGKRVRVSASVRLDAPDENDWAQFGLTIEPTELDGFLYFENSTDRPIRWPEWNRFEIECKVSSDAAQMSFGLTVYGNTAAWLDDVRIEVIEPGDVARDGESSPTGVSNDAAG